MGVHVVGNGAFHRIEARVIRRKAFLGFQQIRRAETALGPETGSFDVVHAENFAIAQGAAVVVGDGRQDGRPAQRGLQFQDIHRFGIQRAEKMREQIVFHRAQVDDAGENARAEIAQIHV